MGQALEALMDTEKMKFSASNHVCNNNRNHEIKKKLRLQLLLLLLLLLRLLLLLPITEEHASSARKLRPFILGINQEYSHVGMIPFVSVATYLFLAPSEDDVWDPPGGWLGTIQETHPAVCLPKRQKHVLAITNRTSKESIDTDTKRM